MTSEIIELAIRSPKAGVPEAKFVDAKNAAVRTLVSLDGIGPEREFAPIRTMPQHQQKVFVGMTRYRSKSRTWRAMVSPSFMLKLMPFMKLMEPHAGIFLSPEDAAFDYQSFASAENLTEFAVLHPAPGVSREQFLEKRSAFLAALGREPEVRASYTFKSVGGFQNADAFVHWTVYRSRETFERLTARIFEQQAFRDFSAVMTPAIICFCTTIK